MDFARLAYRRQFFISTKPIELEGLFQSHFIQPKFHLYYHKDLEFEHVSKDGNSLVLLGNLYDPDKYDHTNLDILNYLINFNFNTLIEKTFKYNGRYILIYYNETELKIFNDPVGLRKVYYTMTSQGAWCASLPHKMAELLDIKPSTEPSLVEFLQCKQFRDHDSAIIIDQTEFDSIFLLKANHYLDLNNGKLTRFWPNKKLNPISLSDASVKAAELLKAYINCIAFRHKVMLPVTAGLDSRLLLAATVDIKDKVFYYINKIEGLKDDSNDIKIPTRLAKKLGIKFHVLDIPGEVDNTFKEIITKNCQYINPNNISLIYQIYFKQFEDYINIPGSFSEVARDQFTTYSHNYTAKDLAEMYYYKDNSYVIEKYDKWLSEVREFKEKYGIFTNDLFYWEERMSNWATSIQQYKDIAQEEVWPFNSRYLMEIMLSTKSKYRDEQTSRLQYRMIKYLWKETLSESINPSFNRKLRTWSKRTGLFYILLYFKLVKNF